MAAALEAAVSNAPLDVGLGARFQASAARNVVSSDDLDHFLISLVRHASSCKSEVEYAALLAKAATGIDRSFCNQSAKQSNPGPLLARARASGVALGKGVRNWALGLKSQRQPLCNTATGLQVCEDMVRFLTDIYAFVTDLAARNGTIDGAAITPAANGKHQWPDSFLEGMRYQMRRMIVNLMDRLSPAAPSVRVKIMWGRKLNNIKHEVAQAAGHLPTETGVHAFLTLFTCKWYSASQDARASDASSTTALVPAGASMVHGTFARAQVWALRRQRGGSKGTTAPLGGTLPGRPKQIQAIESTIMEAFHSRTDGRALLTSILEIGRLRRELRAETLARTRPPAPRDFLSGPFSPTATASAAIPAHPGERYSLSGSLPPAQFGVPAAVHGSSALLYGACSLDGSWVPMSPPESCQHEVESSITLDRELHQVTDSLEEECTQLVPSAAAGLPDLVDLSTPRPSTAAGMHDASATLPPASLPAAFAPASAGIVAPPPAQLQCIPVAGPLAPARAADSPQLPAAHFASEPGADAGSSGAAAISRALGLTSPLPGDDGGSGGDDAGPGGDDVEAALAARDASSDRIMNRPVVLFGAECEGGTLASSFVAAGVATCTALLEHSAVTVRDSVVFEIQTDTNMQHGPFEVPFEIGSTSSAADSTGSPARVMRVEETSCREQQEVARQAEAPGSCVHEDLPASKDLMQGAASCIEQDLMPTAEDSSTALNGWKEQLEMNQAESAALTQPTAFRGVLASTPEPHSSTQSPSMLSAEGSQAMHVTELAERPQPRDALQDIKGLGGLLGDDVCDSLLRDSSGGTGETRLQEVVSCGFDWDPRNNAATAAAEAAAAAAAAAAAGAPDMFIAGNMKHSSMGGACGEGVLVSVCAGLCSVDSASSGGLFEGWLGGAGDVPSRRSTPCAGAMAESSATAAGDLFDAGSYDITEGLLGSIGLEDEEEGADGVVITQRPHDAASQGASETGACVDVRVEEVLAATPSSSSDARADVDAAPRVEQLGEPRQRMLAGAAAGGPFEGLCATGVSAAGWNVAGGACDAEPQADAADVERGEERRSGSHHGMLQELAKASAALRPPPRVVREQLKGTRVLWLENDLWSTLHNNPGADTGGRQPFLTGRPDSAREAPTGSEGVAAIPRWLLGEGVPEGNLSVNEAAGEAPLGTAAPGDTSELKASNAAGGKAVAGKAEPGEDGGSKLTDSGGLEGAAALQQGRDESTGSMGFLCAPDMDFIAGLGAGGDGSMPVEGEAVGMHSGGGAQARNGPPAESVDTDVEGTDDGDDEGSLDGSEATQGAQESPPAMLRPTEVARLSQTGAQVVGEVAVASRGDMDVLTLAVGERPSAGSAPGKETQQAVAGQLQGRLSWEDLTGTKGGGALGTRRTETRETIESIGEVIELPMIIEPLPVIQYYQGGPPQTWP